MKKFIAALLVLSLVVGATISVSAAPADTATAQDGDLIYTYNFKGEDGVFTPDGSRDFKAAYTADVSEDGTSVTIRSIPGATPATNNRNLWGGTLGNLTLTASDAYTLVYKAKANGTANANNLLAVAGVMKAFSTLDAYSEILSNRGNYDTGAETMKDTAIFEFAMGKSTFGVTAKASSLPKNIDVDAEGFMTVMVAYNGITGKIKAYVLSEDGDVRTESDWMEVWQVNGAPGKLAFMVYADKTAVDTTIKDARIYKGSGYGDDRQDITENPAREGYVFAGWYEDAEYTTPIDADVTEGKAFARYVREAVLSVKLQIIAGTKSDTPSTNLRLVTTVDSLEYRSVGFKVEVNGVVKADTSTRTVYQTIKGYKDGQGISYLPTRFSGESKYFMTHTLTGIPSADYDTKITVTPYWKTLDGTVVSGVARTFTINEIISGTAD